MPKPIDFSLRPARSKTYVACEEMNFIWDRPEIHRFRELWDAGVSIEAISDEFGRDMDEVAILAIDQARRGFIGKRKGGAYGTDG